jgi:hypothetical protein
MREDYTKPMVRKKSNQAFESIIMVPIYLLKKADMKNLIEEFSWIIPSHILEWTGGDSPPLTDLMSSSEKLDDNALEISCAVLQSCTTLYIILKLLHPLYFHLVTRTINHLTVKMCLWRSGILPISSGQLLSDPILVQKYPHLHRGAWPANYDLDIPS